jgi:hypothetical protein
MDAIKKLIDYCLESDFGDGDYAQELVSRLLAKGVSWKN